MLLDDWPIRSAVIMPFFVCVLRQWMIVGCSEEAGNGTGKRDLNVLYCSVELIDARYTSCELRSYVRCEVERDDK